MKRSMRYDRGTWEAPPSLQLLGIGGAENSYTAPGDMWALGTCALAPSPYPANDITKTRRIHDYVPPASVTFSSRIF